MNPTSPAPRTQWVSCALVFALTLSLYIATLAPTVLWGDSAKFQRMAYTGQVETNVFGHPLWMGMARWLAGLPLGDVAWRVNLLAALWGAVTVALTFGLLWAIIGQQSSRWALPAALTGAGALAVSHTLWLHAVIAEVYTLNTAIFVALAWLLWAWDGSGSRRRTLTIAAGIGLLLGLGAANHLMVATVTPGLLAGLLLSHHPVKTRGLGLLMAIVAATLGWWLGLLPTGGLSPLPADAAGGLLAAMRGLFSPALTKRLALWLAFLVYQFPQPLLLLAPVGVVYAWHDRRGWAIGLLLASAGTTGWSLSFTVPDQYVFFILCYVTIALWIGLGVAWLLERWQPQGWGIVALLVVAILLPVIVYQTAPAAITTLGLRDRLLPVREIPGRPALTFFLWPPKNGMDGARRFAVHALEQIAPDGLLLADYTLAEPIRYLQQVEQYRPDVEVLALDVAEQVPRLLAQPPGRALYLADRGSYYDLAGIERYFAVVPADPIFILVEKR